MSSTIVGNRVLDRSASPPARANGWAIPLSAGSALFVLDVVALLLLWPLALAVWGPGLRTLPGVVALALYPACAIASHYAVGLYRRDTGASLRRALGRVPVSATMGALGASGLIMLFMPGAAAPGLLAGLAALLAGVGARVTFDVLRRRGRFTRRVLVMGAGKRAWDLVHVLGPGGFSAVAAAVRPDEIVVAPDERRGMDLQGLLDCKIAGYPVSDYLGFIEREVRRVDIKRIELGWLLYSDGFVMGPLDRALKRVLDVAVSSLALVVLAPVMVLAVLAIRLQDRGPALYRQTRVTQHGRHFQILKLRTMRVDAEQAGAAWAAVGDARITPLGALLRRTRLDEVPQLVNVLRGEMSFVGPRPERPEFVEMLASQVPLYRERHASKAGLTGWAQVNYPYGASIEDARSKLSYDLYYVKNFSVLFDILIILQTIRVVLWPGGVR